MSLHTVKCIITEDQQIVCLGERAYNYYDMKPGVIHHIDPVYNTLDTPEIDRHVDVWFEFRHDGGGTKILNGERVCTIEYAQRRGFKDA